MSRAYTDYIDPDGVRWCVEATSESQTKWKIFTFAPGSRQPQLYDGSFRGERVNDRKFILRIDAQKVLDEMATEAGNWRAVPV